MYAFALTPSLPVRAYVLYGWSLRFCCPLILTPTQYPVGSYMFKVNNRKTRSRCEIYSKLTIKTPENVFQQVDAGFFGINFFDNFYAIKAC